MIDYEVRDHVALVTLNRPEARNAINKEMARAIEAAVDRLEADDDVRVGIVRAVTVGDRPVFCSGQDLKALAAGEAGATRRSGFAGLTRRERTKPLVAAVDGLATAGGCEIVLACDLVVASARSAFGLAEVTRGLVAAAGGLFRLPWAIGRAVALEVILTGVPLPAERAHQLGLVNRLVEPADVDTEAFDLAGRIGAAAPLAVRTSREVVMAAQHATEAELWETSDRAMAAMLASEDLQEGLTAFAEKRPPQWRGR